MAGLDDDGTLPNIDPPPGDPPAEPPPSEDTPSDGDPSIEPPPSEDDPDGGAPVDGGAQEAPIINPPAPPVDLPPDPEPDPEILAAAPEDALIELVELAAPISSHLVASSNAPSRYAIRACLVIEHPYFGRIALFSEHLQVIYADIKSVRTVLWDDAWGSVAGACSAMAPFNATISDNPGIQACLSDIADISRSFSHDVAEDRLSECAFSVTLGRDAPWILEDGLDGAIVEVWEYCESILDAVMVASGVVVGNSISGSAARLNFSVTDRSALFTKADVLDYRIRYADFPQAPYTSFADWVPCIYGSVKKYALPIVDEGPTSKIKTALNDIPSEKEDTLNIGVDDIPKFPESGASAEPPDPFNVIVDDEVIAIVSKDSEAGTMLGLRASGSAKHEVGAPVRHFTPRLEWAVTQFGAKTISELEARDSSGSVIRVGQEPELIFKSVGDPAVPIETISYDNTHDTLFKIFSGDLSASSAGTSYVTATFDDYHEYDARYFYDFLSPPGYHPEWLSDFISADSGQLSYSRRSGQGLGRSTFASIIYRPEGTLPGLSTSLIKNIVFPYSYLAVGVSDGGSSWGANITISFKITLMNGTTIQSATAKVAQFYDESTQPTYIPASAFSQAGNLSNIKSIEMFFTHDEVSTWADDLDISIQLLYSWNLTYGMLHSIHFEYEHDLLEGEPNLVDSNDEGNFCSINQTGSVNLPATATVSIGLGRFDIGARSVTDVKFAIKAYTRLSNPGSCLLVRFSSSRGQTPWRAVNEALGLPGVPGTEEFELGTEQIVSGGYYNPVHFTKDWILSEPSMSVQFMLTSANSADVCNIYGLYMNVYYNRAGYTHSLYSYTMLANVDGVPDLQTRTGFPDGTFTGIADGRLIENPADVAAAIACLNHRRPTTELDISFVNARRYYSMLSDSLTDKIIASRPGVAQIDHPGWQTNHWRGYVLLDKNGDTYYINANTSSVMYLNDDRTPPLGECSISGLWRFGGAIDGEIGSVNLWGEFQRTFLCRLGDDVVNNQQAFRMMYPLFNVCSEIEARIYAVNAGPHNSLPSYKIADQELSFVRLDDPVSKVTVNWFKKYFRGQQSSEWGKTTTAQRTDVRNGREVTIDARWISDPVTARLLCEAVLNLFGTRRKLWTIPVVPDALLTLGWGSIIEIAGYGYAMNPHSSVDTPRLCQVVGTSYKPGNAAILSVIDAPIFGYGAPLGYWKNAK